MLVNKAITNSAVHSINLPVRNVLAFSTTRHHPFPDKTIITPPNNYEHFNLGLHVGDNQHHVYANRSDLHKMLPNNTKIQWFDQVHGHHVHLVDKFIKEPIIADAGITRQKNIALAIMTADCLPILLSSVSGDEIAAIHGGWRPLQQGIINKTVGKMVTNPKAIVAWLGPCIGNTAFEVGAEVRESFMLLSPLYAGAFVKKTESLTNETPLKYLADLHFIATLQLNEQGIECINHVNHCTYSRPNEYYSYRRDKQTGRMATVITRL